MLGHLPPAQVQLPIVCYLPHPQAYTRALKCCKPGAPGDEALQPKVYVNLGITQEAEGLLMSACDHYK